MPKSEKVLGYSSKEAARAFILGHTSKEKAEAFIYLPTEASPKLVFTEATGFKLISEGHSFIKVGPYNPDGAKIIHPVRYGEGHDVTFSPEKILNKDKVSLCIFPYCSLTSQVPLGQPDKPLLISPCEGGTAVFTPLYPLHIDVQNGHSLYITQNLAPVTVGLDGTLTLEDVSHAPVEVDMHIGSTINFTYNNQKYTFINPADGSLGNSGFMCLGSVLKLTKLVNIFPTLNWGIQDDSIDNIVSNIKFFKAYNRLDLAHAVVTEFMAQYNIPTTDIDPFCGKHFFKMNAIAKSLPKTEDCFIKILENTAIMERICFYVGDEVDFTRSDHQDNGGGIDLAGDNNQNPDGGAA